MHEVLVNHLGGLSLPKKSVVRLTAHPDMTLDFYHGRKTTTQQQQLGYKHVKVYVYTLKFIGHFFQKESTFVAILSYSRPHFGRFLLSLDDRSSKMEPTINPTALRRAKTPQSFGHFECKRIYSFKS